MNTTSLTARAPGVPIAAEDARWRALRFYNGIRLTFAVLIIAIALFAPTTPQWAPPVQPDFLWIGAAYLLLALGWYVLLYLRRPGIGWQSHLHLGADLLILGLLIYISGGLGGGLGTLMLAPVAVAGLILAPRLAVLYAALASLILLGKQFYLAWLPDGGPLWTQAAIIGLMAFAAALSASFLARRAQESEALAEQRRLELQSLARLNEIVIRSMDSGIVVIDPQHNIRLMNDEATRLLLSNAGRSVGGRALEEISPALARNVREWEAGITPTSNSFTAVGKATDIVPHFTRLGQDGRIGTLIVLEDLALIRRRMQEMKLAALGRLTASIAHEIRNPLAAMSHAGQLLAEADGLGAEEERLTAMILSHVQRVNGIVESVLQLSRQPAARAEQLTLAAWLPEAIEQYRREASDPGLHIDLDIAAADTEVPMDPAHLTQVLWNLLDNARQHGRDAHDEAHIGVRVDTLADGRRRVLDVLDNGPGVDQNLVADVFEPFFTTSHQGAGLGLFISRELCEFNGATLSHLEQPGGGAKFRISFSDTRRQP